MKWTVDEENQPSRRRPEPASKRTGLHLKKQLRLSHKRGPPQFAALPNLLALAVHANIAVKISGACTLSHEPFPYKDLWDPLGRIFDAFGFDRCLWGTDWTRAVGLLTYEQGVEAFRVT